MEKNNKQYFCHLDNAAALNTVTAANSSSPCTGTNIISQHRSVTWYIAQITIYNYRVWLIIIYQQNCNDNTKSITRWGKCNFSISSNKIRNKLAIICDEQSPSILFNSEFEQEQDLAIILLCFINVDSCVRFRWYCLGFC